MLSPQHATIIIRVNTTAKKPHYIARGPIMQRTKPPFRADHVGSLLRAAPLKIAREKAERGEITPAQEKIITL